jgi:hypothetical protein
MNKKYPDEVLTTSKKGKVEVRSLIDQGRFVRYEYIDPESGEKTENKVKLVLVLEDGMEEYFVIPMKDKRNLLIPVAAKGPRKIWDGKAGEPMEL